MEFTKKFYVLLDSLHKQVEFSKVAEQCMSDVTAENEDEGYTINAKSILGFYSLDLGKPVTITVNDVEDAERIEKALVKENIRYSEGA